jgi:hypothetical protein
VAVDGSGNVYVGGDFEGTAEFDGQSFTSAGMGDAFLLKLGPP